MKLSLTSISAPSGIFLQGTELLQSPFQTEFRMGSRSRRYRGSLRAITDFCGVIADFWGVNADPCSVVMIPEVIGECAVAVARLAKHHKTSLRDSLNIIKHC